MAPFPAPRDVAPRVSKATRSAPPDTWARYPRAINIERSQKALVGTAHNQPAPQSVTRVDKMGARAALLLLCPLARVWRVWLGALLHGSLGGLLLLCAGVIEQIAPGPALERPRHVLVALGDVRECGPLLCIAGSRGETRWVKGVGYVGVDRAAAGGGRGAVTENRAMGDVPVLIRGVLGAPLPAANFCYLSCGTGGARSA